MTLAHAFNAPERRKMLSARHRAGCGPRRHRACIGYCPGPVGSQVIELETLRAGPTVRPPATASLAAARSARRRPVTSKRNAMPRHASCIAAKQRSPRWRGTAGKKRRSVRCWTSPERTVSSTSPTRPQRSRASPACRRPPGVGGDAAPAAAGRDLLRSRVVRNCHPFRGKSRALVEVFAETG